MGLVNRSLVILILGMFVRTNDGMRTVRSHRDGMCCLCR